MSLPRGIQERIDWFLSHKPEDFGLCARHSWMSLGGDQGNPPAWGCANANEVYDKVKKSGRYWTGTPKRGALVVWKYGSNGHAAICYDDAGTKICTTDPSNQGSTPTTGVEPISYPSKWGASSSARIWTDQYNGIRFDVGAEIDHGDVYLSKLVYGQKDSDSVKRLQLHLNAHPLDGGEELPVTGNYLDETDEEVRLCQTQHGFGSDPAKGSSVGPKQAGHLFTGCACTIHDDLQPVEPPEPPQEPSEAAGTVAWHNFSGKPSGTLTVADSAGYVMVDADTPDPPAAGLEWHMLYANCDITWDSGSQDGWIRVKYVREGGDATAYQDFSVVRGMSDFLITAQHWEEGEAGVGGRWYVNCGGGIAKLSIGTRYVKGGGVPFELAG